MGVNSTEVAYGFGQMGSILHTGGGAAITSDTSGIVAAHDAIPVGAAFVALTFIEDSVFQSDGGLIAENEKHFISTEGTSLGIDADGGLIVDTVVFPAGVTIYGRWNHIKLASGKLIAYMGY